MSNKQQQKQADDGYDELYADDDMVIVTKKREPLRIEVDTSKLNLRDVMALRELQRQEELSDDEALEHFLPVIERCLIDMDINDVPLPYVGRLISHVVGEVQSMGTRAKNSNGVSPSVSGPETGT